MTVGQGDSGEVRGQDFAMFARGGCWALAQAGHELNGWPVRAVDGGRKPGGHVFVEAPGE